MLNRTSTRIISIFIYIFCTQCIQEQSKNSRIQSTELSKVNDPKICDGNRFKHISTYSLGRQNDLTLTFNKMQKITHVQKVVYKDELFRTYTIFPLKLTFSYSQSKQSASSVGFDRIKITGGTLRIYYEFNWEKKQLSSSIQGTGKGVVTTDPITFIKSLDINSQTKHLEWNFVSAEPITITNSLTINQIKPYKAADYDVINQMLNQLKSGQPTVKTNLIKALNANFTSIIKVIVHQNNDTWKQPQRIDYSYSDYRGQFSISYDNYILNLSLTSGLDLLLSQTTVNDSRFECGQKVPDQPEDEKKYGGLQQFISNSIIKSTLRYAVNRGFLDVILTEEFWQSPAFQFYMGDVHDVIPSTRNMSTLQPITGKCRALDDKYFNLRNKTLTSYIASVNFTCDFKFANNTKRLLGLNLAIDYEVAVILLNNYMDFVIRSITGTPTYFQEEEYKIKNMELANFMVQQTLNMAKSSKVLGSGFKTLSRKFPGVQVREKYLFLFDSSTRVSNKKRKQNKSQKGLKQLEDAKQKQLAYESL